jgi:hypothetical protein
VLYLAAVVCCPSVHLPNFDPEKFRLPQSDLEKYYNLGYDVQSGESVLFACCLFGSLYPESGASTFFRNVDKLLPHHTVSSVTNIVLFRVKEDEMGETCSMQ